MLNKGSLRCIVAIALLLISRWPLRQWYEFEHAHNYFWFAILFFGGVGLCVWPVLKGRIKQLSASRILVMTVLGLLCLPWGEWLRLSMPFARENWSQQILDQTLFLIGCFFFFLLNRKVVEKIQQGIRTALSLISRRRWILPLIPALFFCITSWIGISLSQKEITISDSGSHLFQAQIFSHWKLTASVPPAPEFFNHQNDSLVMHQGKWFSVYLPGFPLMLAIASFLKAEWFVPPLLGALTLAIWLAYIDRWHSRPVAVLFGILLLCSPFFLLQSSTIMVHVAELFFGSAVIYLVRLESEESSFLRCTLLAMALFLAVLTRGFSLMPFLIPILFYGFIRRKSWRTPAFILLGILTGIAAVANYQWQTTGSPWLSAYTLEFPGNRYGFGETLFGQIHTPLRGLEQLSNYLLGLNHWLTGWYSGSLFFIFSVVIMGSSEDVWDRLLVLCCLCLAAFYYFFVGQDLYLGPRYFLVCSPILLLFMARCLGLQSPGIIAALAVSFIISLPVQIPKLVSAWIPVAGLNQNLETLNGRKALIFLPEKEQFGVSLNDPFLKNSYILCRDLGERNHEAIETFHDYRPYYFGMSSQQGNFGISGKFTLSDRPVNSERDQISYFRLGLLMRSSTDQLEKDFFDLSYLGPIGWGDASSKIDFISRSLSGFDQGKTIQDSFRAGLYHSAAAVLLPAVAFQKNKLQWKESFDVEQFRTHLLNARQCMANSQEPGKELLLALEKVNRRIDQDENQSLSDAEILRFVGRKLRLLEEY